MSSRTASDPLVPKPSATICPVRFFCICAMRHFSQLIDWSEPWLAPWRGLGQPIAADALAGGENVKISGFGTFLLRDKAERIGRNPKTGIEVPITPRRVLTFRPSHLMKDRVAAGSKK